jgi:hypothetical protein
MPIELMGCKLTRLFSNLYLLDVVFVHDLLETELDLLVSVLVVPA